MKKPKFGLRLLRGTSEKLLRPFVIPAIVIVGALGLLGYRLLTLVPYGKSELATNLGSANLSTIKNNILFAPIKGLQIFILKFTENDVYIRLASAAVAVTAAVLLYAMLRKWYTTRVSLLTTVMFTTSSWLLHQGRSANLDVLYLTTLPALLLAAMWLISKHNNKKLPLAVILVALTLYTPGSWPFVLFGAFVLRGVIRKAFSQISLTIQLISGGAFIVTLLPLLYGLAIHPMLAIRWLGFNTGQELTAQAIGSHFLDIPKQLFATGLNDPSKWLVGTPVFDVLTIAMVILGIYAYHAGYYASREKLIFGSLIIAIILIGLGNVATLSLLIPILYLLVANGIAYMLQSWFTVFPRNPVARPIGVVLLVVVIAGSCFYQLQRYYAAWPNAKNTTKALISER